MYIAIEGVIGVGKTTLARLLQNSFEAEILLEVFEENPFLSSWMSASLRSFFTFLPSVLLILYTLVRTGRWEEKTIQTELAGEPDTVISEKERARLARETHWRMRRYPWESRRHSRSIVAEQNRLAFLKYQVEQEGGDVQTDPEIVAQRARIERIRASS